tara:strand:- start:240 stop:419 length:180 start_codon:yes stop_codon:yes gene_type:complete
MEKNKNYLITIKYSDSWHQRIFVKAKRIKATNSYKYAMERLNRSFAQSVTVEQYEPIKK